MPSESIYIMLGTGTGLRTLGLSDGECSEMDIRFKKFCVQIGPYKNAEMT
jgi:hypothetical protein